MKTKLLSIFAFSTLGCITLTACNSANQQIKNQQLGKAMSHYFDSFARYPEAKTKLDESKDLLVEAFNKADSDGKYYGLGSIGGAETEKYEYTVGQGVFDAIARAPEIYDDILFFEKAAINKILNSTADAYAEMIGFGTASLFDAIARQPSIIGQLKNDFEYITTSITKVSEDGAYSIGFASKGYYDSVARQPEVSADMWASFKAYIDTLIF